MWENILQTGVAGAGLWDLYNRLDTQKGQIGNDIGDLQQGLEDRTSFTPWTIRGGVGNVGADSGGMRFGLNDQMKSMSNQMYDRGSTMFGRAMQDIGGRTDDLYQQMRATQMPGERRAMQDLDQQMFSRGRTGMGTTEYGSSPERFAFEKARAEADNQAYLSARQGAMGEQLQNYNMGMGYNQAGYTPFDYLYKQAGMGLNNQQLAQQAQLQNANLWTQLGLGGMTSKQNYSNMQSEILRDMYRTGANFAGGIGAGADQNGGWRGLWETMTGGDGSGGGSDALQDFLKSIGAA